MGEGEIWVFADSDPAYDENRSKPISARRRSWITDDAIPVTQCPDEAKPSELAAREIHAGASGRRDLGPLTITPDQTNPTRCVRRHRAAHFSRFIKSSTAALSWASCWRVSSSGVWVTRMSGMAPLFSMLRPSGRNQPRYGMRTVVPSISDVPPVEITPPAVCCPSSVPRFNVLNAWLMISALEKLFSLQSMLIGPSKRWMNSRSCGYPLLAGSCPRATVNAWRGYIIDASRRSVVQPPPLLRTSMMSPFLP